MNDLFRALPSVDACLHALTAAGKDGWPQLDTAPRPLLRELVNAFLDACRAAIRAGQLTDPADLALEGLLPELLRRVNAGCGPHFRRVLNGTGVVLHTNMGRAVLAPEAVEAVVRACSGYSNLELDLATGERGSRYSHVEERLCTLTGAEAALVVNNNAAAVFLTLNTLCAGREVVVARGQLVEIGGSFRIPDVMSRSGAMLREVGCTNRVHAHDYESVINDNTAALMRVHTSNYRVVGFTSDVPVETLAAMAEARGLYCIEDLGSGSLVELDAAGLPGEPTVASVVRSGAHVVTFSGDKVLGGPQAGLIVGTREAVGRIKANPLNRALRIDKMTLAALEATLRLYIDEPHARRRVPTLAMLLAQPDELNARARRLASRIRRALGALAVVELVPGASRVGGGSFPENDLPTTLVRVRPVALSAQNLRQRLLSASPPLMGRVEADAFCLDPRTLTEADLPEVAASLRQVLTGA